MSILEQTNWNSNLKQAKRARGDVLTSILCYVREADVSEEIAQKHVEDMINKCWKKINGQCFNQLPMLQSFVNIATNNAPGAHSLYQYGDGFGVQDGYTRKCQFMEYGSVDD